MQAQTAQKLEPALTETVTVGTAGRILGVSRNTAYALVHSGELPVIRLGRRMVVSRRVLDRMLDGQK